MKRDVSTKNTVIAEDACSVVANEMVEETDRREF